MVLWKRKNTGREHRIVTVRGGPEGTEHKRQFSGVLKHPISYLWWQWLPDQCASQVTLSH